MFYVVANTTILLTDSLRVDPLFKRRKGLRNNEWELATVIRVIIFNYPNPLFK